MITIQDNIVFYNNKPLKRGEKYTINCLKCNKKINKKFYSINEFSQLCSSCKRKETNLKKYGVENPAQSKEIQKKIKINNIKKYGVESHNQLESIKEKKKKTLIDKYGVENPAQSKEIQKKIKRTKLRKYGNEKYNNPEQTKITNLKRYGKVSLLCDNKKYMLEKYGVENSSYLQESIEKRKKSFIKPIYEKLLKSDINPLFTLEEYLEKENKYDKFKWLCKKCNTEFEDYYANGIMPRCPFCYPYYKSLGEKQLYDYVFSLKLNIIENDREIIKPYEVDIYLPDYNLAIEYNGLYYHSIKFINDKYYHQNKVKLANEKEIRLLHIWEHEWLENPIYIKQIILYYMNNLDEKILPKEPNLYNIYDNLIWI